MKKIWLVFLTFGAGCALDAQTNVSEPASAPQPPAVAAPAPANDTNAPPRDQPPTVITSQSSVFNWKSNVYVWEGNVHIDDPQMRLTCDCDVFTAELRQLADGKFNGATAERNVVIDFLDDKGQPGHATSDKAVYTYSITNSVTNKLVVLTGGNPTVTNAQGLLTGDPIILDCITGKVYSKNQETRILQTGTNAPDLFEDMSRRKTNSPGSAISAPSK
jgi:lipopolysaccharide export system protein LptA